MSALLRFFGGFDFMNILRIFLTSWHGAPLLAFDFAYFVGVVAFEVVAYSESVAFAVAGTFVVALKASLGAIHLSLCLHFQQPQTSCNLVHCF